MAIDRRLRTVSGFLLDLYHDARRQEPHLFQRATLQRLRELVSFDFAAWGGGAAEGRLVTDVIVLDQSTRLFTDWMTVSAQDAYCDLALQRLDRTVLFDDVPDFRRSFAWNEHWRRFGAQNMVATIMAEPIDGYVSFVGLCNEDPARTFGEQDRELKQLLMPHVSAALRLNRERRVLRTAEAEEGVAIVNRAGWVLASCGPFARLAREEWGASPRIPEAVLPRRAAATRWRGRVIQARIQPLEDQFLLRVRPYSALSQMTPREQQIAERFAGGLSYKAVAEELSIAPSTVRNHLAHIYEKLGINTKSELVRLLSDEPGL